ncbi:MAG: hypothetical protein CMI36_14900 [Owenweeksia sp.]|nr:hypothetical protein [Owenweeksia sp.]MBG00280.1 hypothetical protein [Owenweeksia sp.]HBF21696.1 hypothetical protein [Cryomorphaceae bacterium]|tara:strand:- start:6728 stop:7414 length:687 start_codon:yes stop_codon:yes gene_type:complete
MKIKITGSILSVLISLFAIAQNQPCPQKNQKGYACGQVEEQILSQLQDTDYEMPTTFKVMVAADFKKETDTERANQVAALCTKVLNDPDFWNALENYGHYRYTLWKGKEGKERVIEGSQIVNSLINGHPNDSSRPLELVINLNIELYGMGFRFPFFEKALAKEIGDGKIYNKKWFFRKFSIEAIGSNWIHEFSHSQGLSHCYYCDENRDYSIPYVINRIFMEVSSKYQ